MCAAPKGLVFGPFWSENGYTLAHFGLESVMISNYGSIIMKYLSFQFQMNKTDAFEEFFCLRSNLSNTLFSRMVICPSNLVFE